MLIDDLIGRCRQAREYDRATVETIGSEFTECNLVADAIESERATVRAIPLTLSRRFKQQPILGLHDTLRYRLKRDCSNLIPRPMAYEVFLAVDNGQTGVRENTSESIRFPRLERQKISANRQRVVTNVRARVDARFNSGLLRGSPGVFIGRYRSDPGRTACDEQHERDDAKTFHSFLLFYRATSARDVA